MTPLLLVLLHHLPISLNENLRLLTHRPLLPLLRQPTSTSSPSSDPSKQRLALYSRRRTSCWEFYLFIIFMVSALCPRFVLRCLLLRLVPCLILVLVLDSVCWTTAASTPSFFYVLDRSCACMRCWFLPGRCRFALDHYRYVTCRWLSPLRQVIGDLPERLPRFHFGFLFFVAVSKVEAIPALPFLFLLPYFTDVSFLFFFCPSLIITYHPSY
jgi:hypothetical protein